MNYAGQILINNAAIDALRPHVKEDGDTWAERVIEDIPYSPYPGRLSLKFTPWLREPIQACTSDASARLVVMLMAVQGGKTLCYDLATAYHSAHNASSILVISDTDDNAKDYAKTRLNSLFESNAQLKRLLSTSHRKSTDMMHMLRNGTFWWTTGAANIKNLQRRSIRIVVGDEVWLWPDGHMAEAAARTTRFSGTEKVIFGSQAGTIGQEMVRYWEQTDKREWAWRCPHCQAVHHWNMEMVDWDLNAKKEDGSQDYDTIRKSTRYKCPACAASWDDSDKSRAILNAASFWTPTANAESSKRGYHMTSIPYMHAGDLACEFVTAQAKLHNGDPTAYQIFTQKRLAEFWDPVMGANDEDAIRATVNTEKLYGSKLWERMSWLRIDKDRKRSFVDVRVPEKGVKFAPLIFLTVDVQRGYFWYVVRAWNRDGSSMLLECGLLEKWDDIPAKAAEYELPPANVGLDVGDQSQRVADFCSYHRYYALRGLGVESFTHCIKMPDGKCLHVEYPYSPTTGKVVSGGGSAKLVKFSANAFKDILHFAKVRTIKRKQRRDAQEEEGDDSSYTWEIPENVPEFYTLHLSAEKRVRQPNGTFRWVNRSNIPNHCLDCETMNACLAMRKGIPL